tara:strand:- start:583 stop:1695 length:1113 start_codon:yes stop_codon:yes gene_type:complete
MSKVLFTASIAKHILRFHLPYLKWFKDQGYEVHVACSGAENIPFCDIKWQISFVRSPFSFGHYNSFSKIKHIIEEQEYDLIHTHTPMTSLVTRYAAKSARKKGTKVLYTAHGFHFYKGAPILNWLFFYPIEKYFSKYADAIITINSEDYEILHRNKFKNKDSYMIPGIGVSNDKFHEVSNSSKAQLRSKLKLNIDDFLIIYAAEFISRKNHQFILSSINEYSIPANMKVLFAGRGELEHKLKKKVIELGLEKQIIFLGFIDNINEYYQASDIGISTSKQEGLGLNLIEELMCGLPVVATIDRGHSEIIENGVNGYFYPQNNGKAFYDKVMELYLNKEVYNNMKANATKSVEMFSLTHSIEVMSSIYSKYL